MASVDTVRCFGVLFVRFWDSGNPLVLLRHAASLPGITPTVINEAKGHPLTRRVTPLEANWLKDAGCIAPRCTINGPKAPMLVPLCALAGREAADALLREPQALHSPDASELRAAFKIAYAVVPMPEDLPDLDLPDYWESRAYSLRPADAPPATRDELAAFGAWACAPVNVDRASARVSTGTFDDVHTPKILALLGFDHHVLRRPLDELGVARALLDGRLISSACAFLLHVRGCAVPTVTSHLRSWIKGLLWVDSTLDDDPDVADHIERVRRLLNQLAATADARAEVAELVAAGKWADWPDIVRGARAHARTLLDGLPQTRGWEDAYKLSRSLLFCLLGGGYIPPLRSGTLASLCFEGRGGCRDPDCRVTDCQGNQLDREDGTWVLNIRHHKTSRRGRLGPVNISLAPNGELHALVCEYSEWAYGLLTGHSDATARGHLFVQASGGPHTTSSLWASVNSMAGSVVGAALGPHAFRHSFVTHMMSAGLEESDLEGLATAMGNSLRAWRLVYDRRAIERSVNRGLAVLQRLDFEPDPALTASSGDDDVSLEREGPGAADSALALPPPPPPPPPTRPLVPRQAGRQGKPTIHRRLEGAEPLSMEAAQALSTPQRKRAFEEMYGKAPRGGNTRWLLRRLTEV